MNDLGDQVIAAAANGESRVSPGYGLHSRDRPKALFSERIGCRENDGPFSAMPVDKAFWPVDVDDPSMLDDCYPVAQPFGFLHQMRGQKDRLAALADAAHQIPDCPPRLRSEEHTSELQSLRHLVCRLLLEKKKKIRQDIYTY